MNISSFIRMDSAQPQVVASSEVTNHSEYGAMCVDVAVRDGKLLGRFGSSILIGTALIVSGIFHLTLLWVTGADWSGPLCRSDDPVKSVHNSLEHSWGNRPALVG